MVAYAWALAEKMQHVYADMVDRLQKGDVAYKRFYDRRHKFVGVFVAGQRVFMKTRLHGIFTTRL